VDVPKAGSRVKFAEDEMAAVLETECVLAAGLSWDMVMHAMNLTHGAGFARTVEHCVRGGGEKRRRGE